MTRLASILALIALLILLPRSSAAEDRLLFHDAVIARVGDKAISVLDVRQESAPLEAELRARLGGEELEKEILALRRKIADDLVNRELFHLEFKERGFMLPGELLQRRLDRLVVTQAAGSRERFEKMLAEQGSSILQLEEELGRVLAVELFYDHFVRRQVHVSAAAVEAFFKEKNAEMSRPDRYLLRLILLRPEGADAGRLPALAAEIRQAAAGGADFAGLAAKHSAESVSAAKGGSLDWLDAGDLKESWLAAVKGLKPGEISAPVTEADGSVVILQMAEFAPGGAAVLDDRLREEIENELSRREERRRYDELSAQLSTKFFVRKYY